MGRPGGPGSSITTTDPEVGQPAGESGEQVGQTPVTGALPTSPRLFVFLPVPLEPVLAHCLDLVISEHLEAPNGYPSPE